uniref:Transforming growth factor beta regulator 1 n=2 Tax=Lygus hesperus TaxID=30085 RepID=A0A0A9WII7_LYGHE
MFNSSGFKGSPSFIVRRQAKQNLFSVEKLRNEKYKKKYKTIKRQVRELIFENAALCDQIAQFQESTLLLIDERNFLFKKLQQYHPIPDPEVFRTNSIHNNHHDLLSKKAVLKKRTERTVSDSSTNDSTKMSKHPKKPQVARKKKIVKAIPLDSCGKPIFPISLGDFTVHSLGEVCEKPEYHTEDLIFPVGYCSTRVYGSLKDPEKQCMYTCKVMDGGLGPKFEIVADTDLDVPIVSTSIDSCHSMLLSLINRCLGMEIVNTKGRGADFFGISHPTIHHLIQASPGVRKCKGYVWTKFEVNPTYEYTPDDEASLSYSALLRSISFSKSHMDPGIKDEPPSGEYHEDHTAALRSLLMS